MAAVSLTVGVLGFGGCADYVGVGYGSAYYVPDYVPFYGAYYYDGVPIGDRMSTTRGRRSS